jgi:hypothetical protein
MVSLMENITPPMPAKRALAALDQAIGSLLAID